jgi:serine/threonine protein kinase
MGQITRVENFAEHYTLGREVMPATHKGMEVLWAKRVRDGKDYVVKKYVKSQTFSRGEEGDFRHNVEFLLRLPRSENIAQIYRVLEDADAYYAVMEKCEGLDLFEVIDKQGPCTLNEARSILRKLLQGVLALHSNGCIHRDLKLENVMVERRSESLSPKTPMSLGRTEPGPGEQCVNDAGADPIVKIIDFDTLVECSSTKVPPKPKSLVGTNQYISNEAYSGEYSKASDIFAVGVIAYKLICGKHPFRKRMFDDQKGERYIGSPKMEQIRQRLIEYEINWTQEPWQSESEAQDLTRWMLERSKDKRPTAAEALNHVFFTQGPCSPALPQGPWGSRRERNSALGG